MHKGQKSKGGHAVFYKPAGVASAIRSGYLIKSPPSKKMKTEKAWKLRFFVLFKVSDLEHQLNYFKSPEDKDRPLGVIDLSSISTLYLCPENNQSWHLIPKRFRSSPSSVLYIRTINRDYFLVGESSDEVDAWFSDIFEALKNRPHVFNSTEELSDEQQTTEAISDPVLRTKKITPVPEKPLRKIRSISDPCEIFLNGKTEQEKRDIFSRRRASEPVNPVYDYPKPFPLPIQVTQENGSATENKTEALYETMYDMSHNKEHAADIEVEDICKGTLMRSVTQIYEKMKIQISPLPPFSEESDTEDRDETHPSDSSSSSSSENDPTSPAEMHGRSNLCTPDSNESTTESPDPRVPEKRDVKVNPADLKKYLTIAEVDGKLSVTGWTGQPKTECLLTKGDTILGVNGLQVSNMEEFNMYISKSLKNKVKVTILPEHQTLHSPTSSSSDGNP